MKTIKSERRVIVNMKQGSISDEKITQNCTSIAKNTQNQEKQVKSRGILVIKNQRSKNDGYTMTDYFLYTRIYCFVRRSSYLLFTFSLSKSNEP